MKIMSMMIIFFLLITGCKEQPVKPPVVQNTVIPAENEILGVVTGLSVPRVLKIDHTMKIVIKGYFDVPGYAYSRIEMKRDDNEIAFKVFGKPSAGNNRFEKTVTLPPQPAGEYDIVVHGKNKRFNDITWVEEYQGDDRLEYLKRLKQLREQNPAAAHQRYSPDSFQVN